MMPLRVQALAAALLFAAVSVIAANNFSVREQKVKAPEMGELLTYVLTSGTDEFSFVPPYEWRLTLEPERRRVVLTTRDRTANISIQVMDANLALKPKADPALLREQVQKRFSSARILAEFATYTSSHAGRGFDVSWTGPGDVQMESRTAYYATPNGSIEFTLTTRADRFKKYQNSLGGVMTSFQHVGSPQPVSTTASR
jgi:hypothetical protein